MSIKQESRIVIKVGETKRGDGLFFHFLPGKFPTQIEINAFRKAHGLRTISQDGYQKLKTFAAGDS